MRLYFEGSERGFRGRPRETLVTNLNKDITRARAMERSFPLLNMKNNGDFEKIRSTAKDRKKWRRLSEVVCRAAEAEATRNLHVRTAQLQLYIQTEFHGFLKMNEGRMIMKGMNVYSNSEKF